MTSRAGAAALIALGIAAGCGATDSLPEETAAPVAGSPTEDSGVVGTAGTEANEPSAILGAEDFASTWVRLGPPSSEMLGQLESVVATDDGFAALYRRSLGDGKVVAGWDNRVLTTRDGVEWTDHPLLLSHTSHFYRGLAFGNGLLLAAGTVGSDSGSITGSSDGSTWSSFPAPPADLRTIVFLHDAFFALGQLGSIFRSTDGRDWAEARTSSVQLSAAAYGAGRYVAVGSGPIQVSSDGQSWREVVLDCGLAPEACITDPSGGVHGGYLSEVFFGAGAFHAQGFVSRDAESWEHLPAGAPVPVGSYGGHLMRIEGSTLEAWLDGDAQTTRVELRDDPGALRCGPQRCFVLGQTLLLLP